MSERRSIRFTHYPLRRLAASIAASLAALAVGLHCPQSESPAPAPTGGSTAGSTGRPTGRPAGGPASRPTDHPTGGSDEAAAETMAARATARDARPAIVFLGTSLTAGYGLPESEAYPALVQDRLEAADLDYRVVNAGVSGDTSAGGLRRLDWLLRLPIAVLVVELGANDMLRGQSVEALEDNLAAIFERTRAVHPDVRFVVAGMRAAPNLGRTYGDAFDAIYPRLAERFDAQLVPFLLEDVAARRDLNQADGIHPTAEGHALIAERVWKALEPVARAAARD